MQHAHAAGAGIAKAVGGLVGATIGLAWVIFWVWMLVHAITNNGLTDGEKILWVLLIILLPCLGVILYFFIGRPKKR